MTVELDNAVRDFADRCLDSRTPGAAAEHFVASMHTDPEFAPHTDAWIREVCLRGAAGAIKMALKRSCAPSRLAGDDYNPGTRTDATVAVRPLPTGLVQAWGASVSAGFKFELPGGKALGDATRADLAKASYTFRTQGKASYQKAVWLDLIAQGLPTDATVKERFKPLRLTELANEAEKAVKAGEQT
jgi:hypothetical protein